MITSNITGAAAYAAIQGRAGTGGPSAGDATDGGTFGAVLQNAMARLSEVGKNADAMSAQAMTGGANMTDVVMAVSKAEMALQASVAVRDKVVSAYQDIMRMTV